jgi:hypothetical protein
MTATAARATCASFSHCVRAAESRKSPQNSDFYGHRTTYSEKAHCIKDSVLLENKQSIPAPFVQVALPDESHEEKNVIIHGKQVDIEIAENISDEFLMRIIRAASNA